MKNNLLPFIAQLSIIGLIASSTNSTLFGESSSHKKQIIKPEYKFVIEAEKSLQLNQNQPKKIAQADEVPNQSTWFDPAPGTPPSTPTPVPTMPPTPTPIPGVPIGCTCFPPALPPTPPTDPDRPPTSPSPTPDTSGYGSSIWTALWW